MKSKHYNQKRACALEGVYRRNATRRSDTELRARMEKLAPERRRPGYHHMHTPLKRTSSDRG